MTVTFRKFQNNSCVFHVMHNNFRHTVRRSDCCVLYPIHFQEKSQNGYAQNFLMTQNRAGGLFKILTPKHTTRVNRWPHFQHERFLAAFCWWLRAKIFANIILSVMAIKTRTKSANQYLWTKNTQTTFISIMHCEICMFYLLLLFTLYFFLSIC